MKVNTNWHGFAAAHRLAWHPKCQRMHGHVFRVRVSVEGEVDEEKGIMVDFGVVNRAVEKVVEPLDHRFLAPEDARIYAEKDGKEAYCELEWGRYRFPASDVVVMPMKHVSTENLASWILGELVKQEWAQGLKVTVHLDESGDNGVEVSSSVYSLFDNANLNQTIYNTPGMWTVGSWKRT